MLDLKQHTSVTPSLKRDACRQKSTPSYSLMINVHGGEVRSDGFAALAGRIRLGFGSETSGKDVVTNRGARRSMPRWFFHRAIEGSRFSPRECRSDLEEVPINSGSSLTAWYLHFDGKSFMVATLFVGFSFSSGFLARGLEITFRTSSGTENLRRKLRTIS